MCLSLNPNGPGFFLMGWSGQSADTFAVRCVDGIRLESIDGGAQHNGWDHYSVDWTADPPVVFVKVHHTKGMTKLSTDGGKTVRGISLYGIGPELRDWFGQWPMHRSWRDVFGDGAEVYSEFTVPQTLAPAAMTYATIYALEKQAGTIPPGSKPNPLEH